MTSTSRPTAKVRWAATPAPVRARFRVAVVGSAAGPVGTVAGAVAGGMLGAAAGDAAKHMGENHTQSRKRERNAHGCGRSSPQQTTPVATHGHTTVVTTDTPGADLSPGNEVPGVQTGGHAVNGTPDTRGVTEKAADALTGDRVDDKTGKVV